MAKKLQGRVAIVTGAGGGFGRSGGRVPVALRAGAPLGGRASTPELGQATRQALAN